VIDGFGGGPKNQMLEWFAGLRVIAYEDREDVADWDAADEGRAGGGSERVSARAAGPRLSGACRWARARPAARGRPRRTMSDFEDDAEAGFS
jgi:hypothetical protein